MAYFKCKTCGAPLPIQSGRGVVKCEYCGVSQTVPIKLDIDLSQLYEEADNLRRKKEFDRAVAIYDQIIARDNTQCEAYWGRILCKYGIEYIKDTAKNKEVPTCHIVIYEPVVNNDDYKKVIEYADEEQRVVYKKCAEEIDRIHRELLTLSRNKEKYDVFICYKQTDENGKRTLDSTLAEKIYNELRKEGIKVFFAHITLKDKLGEAYEPIIFSALNSAKVMLAVGTKPEYFNSVWVKNEWSRYLNIIKNDSSKYLIPCYRDMSANELPEEMQHLEAQDMSEIAFSLDLVRGVKKILGKDKEPIPPVTPVEKHKKTKKIAKAVIPLVAIVLLIAIFFTVVVPIIQNRREDTAPPPETQKVIETTENTEKPTDKNNSSNSETDAPVNNEDEIFADNGTLDNSDSSNDRSDDDDDDINDSNNKKPSNEENKKPSPEDETKDPDDVIGETPLEAFEFTRSGEECVITGLKDNTLTEIVIPNGVTSIGDRAFSGCDNLISILISDSVKTIGYGAFEDCSKLSSIVINSGVNIIAPYVFKNCDALEKVEIPDNVTKLDTGAFRDCDILSDIKIGKGIKDLSWEIFMDCKSLTNITIPENICTIGSCAFARCINLDNVVIPNSVTYVHQEAFGGCSNLTSVVIGSGVEKIYDSAFCACNNLTSVEFKINNGWAHAENSDGKNSVDFSPTDLANSSIAANYLTDVYMGYYWIRSSNNDTLPDVLGEAALAPYEYTKSGNECVITGLKDKTLTEIVIPNGVTKIGDSAFLGCQNLESITIANTVTDIGSLAFSGCVWLTNITIPNGVKSIGDEAFNSCVQLKNITIPDSVTNVGEAVFRNCYRLATVKIGNGVTAIEKDFFSCCESLTDVTIGSSVSSIGENAFCGCSNLTSITIPNSVTSIDGYAFSLCSKLTDISVDVNNTKYKSINGNVYTKDEKILVCYAVGKTDKSFTIPNSVTSIGEGAFSYCSNLTSITIPNSVTSIGKEAFDGCSNLTGVEFETTLDWYYSSSVGATSGMYISASDLANKETAATYLTETYSDKYWYWKEHVCVDGDKDKICDGCQTPLYSVGLVYELIYDGKSYYVNGMGTCTDTDVSIPPTYNGMPVTSIGDCAFLMCDNLTSITIPNSVMHIGESAFSHCSNLTSITIPNSVTSIGEYAFYLCHNLTSITIPNSVTSIGVYAFSDCSNLTSVEFETTLDWYYSSSAGATSDMYISASDLANKETAATYLTETYSEKYWYWKEHACADNNNDGICDGCQIRLYSVGLEYELNSDGSSYSVRGMGTCTDTDVIIPSKYNGLPVTNIWDGAFSWCDNLTSITISNSMTRITIDEWTFNGCTGLTSIIIPDSVVSIGISHLVLEECINLKNIIVDENNAFYKSIDGNLYTKDGKKLLFYPSGKKAASFEIPDGVTSIIDYTFYECTDLLSITIPNSVTSIGNYAFSGCTGLTSIIIPDSVTRIGDGAFEFCTGLLSIKLSNSLKDVGDCAFTYCKGITSIIIPSSLSRIDLGMFSYCTELKHITISNGVTEIEYTAFEGCTSLVSITIPDSVMYISDDSFGNCTNLENIIVDKNNTVYQSIDGNLYTKDGKTLVCYAVGKTDKSFTIPNSVTSIGEYAFQGCSNLTSITIPNSVTSIGYRAFEDCSNLTSITIPNNVTSIGLSAFYLCSNLTSVTFENTSGWSAGSTSISSVDISNPSTAAEYLKNTYCKSSWRRS